MEAFQASQVGFMMLGILHVLWGVQLKPQGT